MRYGAMSVKLAMEKEQYPRQILAQLVLVVVKLPRVPKNGLIVLIVAEKEVFLFHIRVLARPVAVGAVACCVNVVVALSGGPIKLVAENVLNAEK